MPTISCTQKDLEKLIGKKLGKDGLLSLLPMAKAEFDGELDQEWRVELQDTNRPDLWSAEGIARQLKSCLTGERPVYDCFSGKTPAAHAIEVDPNLETIRPMVGAFIARGVKVDEETLVQIIQTQEKLCDGYGHQRREAAMGVYDASAITFPVKYRAVKGADTKFTPLGFEEAMSMDAILEQHPKGRDYRHLVQGKPYYPLLEDAEGTVLSFPPVINSRALGEVKVGDDNLFIEVTGHRMKLITLVLNIMAANLADRGWEIIPIQTEFPYHTPLGDQVTIPYDLSTTQTVSLSKINDYLGLSLDAKEACTLLTKYGVAAENSGDTIKAVCPPYRADYMHPCDVIEDVAIAHGFEAFEPISPTSYTVAGLAPITLFADKVRQELVGYGFQEVFSNVLLSRDETRTRLGLTDEPLVEINNYVSETYSVVRDRLLTMLLRVESRSTKALYPHRIFEVGEVAVVNLDNNHGSDTEVHAAALIASKDAGFSDGHAYLDALMYFMAKPYTLKSHETPFAIAGRCAAILSDKKEAGIIAEIHPSVLEAWGIEVPITMFEINLTTLLG